MHDLINSLGLSGDRMSKLSDYLSRDEWRALVGCHFVYMFGTKTTNNSSLFDQVNTCS